MNILILFLGKNKDRTMDIYTKLEEKTSVRWIGGERPIEGGPSDINHLVFTNGVLMCHTAYEPSYLYDEVTPQKFIDTIENQCPKIVPIKNGHVYKGICEDKDKEYSGILFGLPYKVVVTPDNHNFFGYEIKELIDITSDEQLKLLEEN